MSLVDLSVARTTAEASATASKRPKVQAAAQREAARLANASPVKGRLANTSQATEPLATEPATPERDSGRRKARRGRDYGERTSLSRYLADIRKTQPLSREDEATLAARIQAGDQTALHTLVEANLQFAVKIASEYQHMGLPFEDLVNEGNLGLIEAARRYDPDRGTRFISWAVWWIRKTICQALSDHCQVVRLPVSQLRKMRIVRGIERSMTEDLGREPTDEELAAKLPADLARLDPIHRYGLRLSSLDEPVGEEQAETVADNLEDSGQTPVDQALSKRQTQRSIGSLLDRLDERQQVVIAHRFGLGGTQPLTLEEIGERIGRSREGVRLIERRAIAQLRRGITANQRIRPLAHPAATRTASTPAGAAQSVAPVSNTPLAVANG